MDDLVKIAIALGVMVIILVIAYIVVDSIFDKYG